MKVLTDAELVREWMSYFGVTTGSRLLGWCVLTVVPMPRGTVVDARALIEHGSGSISTRYRNLHHLQGFKAHLEEQGFVVADEERAVPGSVLAHLEVAS